MACVLVANAESGGSVEVANTVFVTNGVRVTNGVTVAVGWLASRVNCCASTVNAALV